MAMMPKSILTKLVQEYNTFTKSEKKITDYVLAHKQETQYMTITELALECKVAEATLTRYCRRLGCGGFNEFKLSLAKAAVSPRDPDSMYGLYGEINPTDSVDDMCQKLYNADKEALTQTFQLMDPESIVAAVDFIQRADRVYCYGQGGSSILAMEAWGRFVTVTSKVQWIQDSHMQAMAAALLRKNDVILYFSFSGATRELMDITQIAAKRGVRLILVTRFPKSPGAAYADVLLLCGAVEGPLQLGSVAAKVSQLYIIDVLFNEFCRRDMKKSLENRDGTAKAIANKHL